jgi:hypothetical protein
VPRRILLLITDLEIGGTPTVVRELATRLRSDDVHVEVASLKTRGPVGAELVSSGVDVTALNARSMLELPLVARRLRQLILDRRIWHRRQLPRACERHRRASPSRRTCGSSSRFKRRSLGRRGIGSRSDWWRRRRIGLSYPRRRSSPSPGSARASSASDSSSSRMRSTRTSSSARRCHWRPPIRIRSGSSVDSIRSSASAT